MRIESLLYIVDGKLQNSPAIKEVNNITSNIEKIKRGDLFIAREKKNIPQAIENGAYGILYEGSIKITDKEIAWIRVENLTKALYKLLRFLLIEKKISIFALKRVEFDLAKNIIEDNRVLFEDILEKLIENIEEKDIFICTSRLIKKLSLPVKRVLKKDIRVIREYIFETSFIYNEEYFNRILIPPIFLEELKKVLYIIDKDSLNFSFSNLPFNHFTPYFIDKNFEIKEFGKSNKAIILENEPSLINKEIDFLQKRAPWAKTILIKSQNFDKVKEILYNSDFNYALILTQRFEIEKLRRDLEIKTLF